ncbi:protein of unknown function DUF324 [Sulfolobus islandicus M.14.25]|uniref:CRISPR type III-associated protein domain-containing protein n=3 Tax=Saccharolobus islandicus TaxID=43080 RepID=C3MXB2_SACI4|nr:RAMP superfamily CRISPR-associated protein [Sulfolobus islandicus]ACP37792.1 protein of unknown function DUF324 [Sulfolobus islandicus M.14.25]ACP54986.1 protein of unknown function DUF324 [Sulfolobus islandicus M.16.27]
MIRIHVKLIPLTPYNISSSLRTRERKVVFYFGVDPSFKFIPPTSIKGILRTAACYAFFESVCETVTAKILILNREKIEEELKKCENGVKFVRQSFDCAELQKLRESKDCESKVYASVLESIIDKFSSPCIVCRVFGSENAKAKMRIVMGHKNINTYLIGNLRFSYDIKTNSKGLDVEVSKDQIEFDVLCEDDECKDVIIKALEQINNGTVRLGRFKSRGFGIIRAEYEVIQHIS